jgi:phage terminase small subunit
MPNNPKSTSLKTFEGGRSHRPPRTNPTPKSGNKIPRAPHWLGKEAKKEWRRLARELHELGLLTSIDLWEFAITCDLFAAYKNAETVKERLEISKELRQHMGILGLGPKSRSGLDVKKTKVPGTSIEEVMDGHSS